MGRGESGTVEVAILRGAKSFQPKMRDPFSFDNEFAGFSREESVGYASNILQQSGAKPGEEIIIRLGDQEQLAAGPAFMEAADRLGLAAPRILPHDHVLSDQEVATSLESQEKQLAGKGVSISLSSLPGGSPFSPHTDFFDWIEGSPQSRDALVRDYIRELTDKSNIEDLRRWNVAIWPNRQWSRLVFPESDDPEKEMANLLASATYSGDPEGLKNHLDRLDRRKNYMTDLLDSGYKKARIQTPPDSDHPLDKGTDLRMTICDGSQFASVKLDNSKGDAMILNNPTDEVYGTPLRSSVSGHFTSTRPYITKDEEGNTIIIPGVYGEFENGKLVRIESFDPQYNAYLERDFQKDADPPTDVLGELGLVDSSGPLARAQHPDGRPRTFFNNILDENTGVHIGFGMSYAQHTGGEGDRAPVSGVAHRDIVIGNENTTVSFSNDAGDEKDVIRRGLWQNE